MQYNIKSSIDIFCKKNYKLLKIITINHIIGVIKSRSGTVKYIVFHNMKLLKTMSL